MEYFRAAKLRVTRRKGYDERMVDDALDAYAQRLDAADRAGCGSGKPGPGR